MRQRDTKELVELGFEKNSATTPILNRAPANRKKPLMRARAAASVAALLEFPFANGVIALAIRSEMAISGPTTNCLELPNIGYTSKGTKAA